MEKNRKTTRSAGRPAIGGNRRQYAVNIDVLNKIAVALGAELRIIEKE